MHKQHDSDSKRLTLGDIIEWSSGASSMPARARAAAVATVWNDSRKVTPGDAFVAIATDRDDGHHYVAAAFKAGAAAVIVDKKARVECSDADRGKLIVVADTQKAIARVATRYRQRLGLLLIGVTGSSGKTTTRTFISAVLRTTFAVGETYTNWNNHIGVPLSLLRFSGDEWAGVIEMGANHAGEIHALSKIARPDIALITNIGWAHVGLFGSLANTTRAKFEIADGLTSDGFLLLNGDDERVVAHSRKLGIPCVYFGVSPRCQVRPDKTIFDSRSGLDLVLGGHEFHLSVPGRHFMYSALPAIFLGRRCGVPDSRIAQALAQQKPVAMRGTVEKKKGVSFIVDCYNANPSSMRSAVTALADLSPVQKRVAVVGDMLELGKYAKRLHQELGRTLAKFGVQKVVAVGQFSREVAHGATAEGMAAGRIVTVAKAEDAVASLRELAEPGEVVLLKGSRGVHLETVFEKF
jgi:UDP-N-acetylmuramoyl-tripeptide--D-alanyl-D-alanine ligase